MKKVVPVLITLSLSIALSACSKSKEQTFIDLNKNKVTLDQSGNAIINMKTNKEAKYTILDADNKDKKLFAPKTTKTGNVRLTLSGAGKYKVRVTNDEDVETKTVIAKSPKVSAGDNAEFSGNHSNSKGLSINKTTNTVGAFQYKITTITNEKVKNTEDNYTDAEYNLDDRDSLNSYYYRTIIKYELKNVGTQPVDLSYTQSSLIGDNGTDYTFEGNVGSYGYDSLVGEGKVQPNTIKNGKFILISNEKMNIKNPKINVGEQYANDDTQISEGGIAALQ